MINILICDDEDSYKEILIYKISKLFESKINQPFNIDCCKSIEALEDYVEKKRADIVFLDIMINERNSIDWLIKNQARLRSTQFIIMTAFPVEGYKISETDSCYFLIKTRMTNEQILSALKKAIDNISNENENQRLIKIGSRSYTIDLNDITFIETFNNNIDLHTFSGEKYTLYSSLKAFAKELTPQFLRCHKSYMVNMDYITSYEPHRFLLKNKEEVPISSKNYLKTVDTYRNYLLNI